METIIKQVVVVFLMVMVLGVLWNLITLSMQPDVEIWDFISMGVLLAIIMFILAIYLSFTFAKKDYDEEED